MSYRKLLISVAIIILLSTLLKLYYAYLCSFYIWGDTGVIGLIAKQILRGEFPLFFYGHFYMGTLESWIIAPFFFLFGVSSYTIHLGPIFVSVIFLISTYYLGKELGGDKIGLIALMYCAIPPFYLLKQGVIPLGYHIEMLAIGNVIFILTLKIYNRPKGFIPPRDGGSRPGCERAFGMSPHRGIPIGATGVNPWGSIYFCLLGLISGLGFWNTYLILYYLMAACIFLVLSLTLGKRFGYLLYGGLISLFSFFLGGIHFWIFNITHNFASFKFLPFTSPGFLILFRKILSYHLPGILGFRKDILSIILASVYICSGIFFIFSKTNKKWVFIIFILVMIFFLTRSKFYAVCTDYRYVLPLFSVLPFTLAFFLDWINKKIRFLGSSILCVIIIINSLQILKGFSFDRGEFISEGMVYNKLIDFFKVNNVTGVYGGFTEVGTINFIGQDTVFAAEIPNSSAPFDTEVQSADRIAFIDMDHLIPVFDMLCKSYKQVKIDRCNVLYDFRPREYYGEEILPEGWKAVTNCNPGWAEWAFNRNLDRYWSSITPKKTGMYFQVEFPKVYKIYKFQIFNIPSDDPHLPEGYRVLVSKDGINWELIKECNVVYPMFWSGPNIIFRVRDTRWEVIFNPVEARFVRIEQIGESRYPWEINEIMFYEYKGDKPFKIKDYVRDAKGVYLFINGAGINFVYADYWLSARMKRWSKGDIGVLGIYNECWQDRKNLSRMIKLDRRRGIVVEKANARQTEAILDEYELPFRKKVFGNYILYYFIPVAEKDEYLLNNQTSLYWTVTGVSRINLNGFGKLLMDYAGSYYIKAVRYFPANPSLRNKLLQMYKEKGEDILFEREKMFIRHRFIPGIRYHARFNGGIEFLGWSISKKEIARGDTFKADYFWSVKRELKEIGHLFVFVHFIKDGQIIFQNDHRLLENYLRPYVSLVGGVWKESYMVKIPMSAPIGEYVVRLGLWLPGMGGKRINILESKSTSAEVGRIIIGQNRLLQDLKGRVVFQSDAAGNKEIYVMDADGSNVKKLTNTGADNSYPNFSPDGKNIIFMSNRDGNNEIYIIDRNGDNERRLTDNSGDDVSPSWHPDGKRIIFVSDRDGAMNFYLMDKDGGGLTRITDFKEGVHDLPRISPDGREIIFTSNMSQGWQIFKMDMDGGNLKQISNLLSGHCEGIWSHDGGKILFISRPDSGNSEVYIMDRDGGNEKRITTHHGLDYNPRFSPDDKKIIFSSERDGNWEIYVINRDGSNPVRVTYTDAREEWPDWGNTD